MIQPKLNSFKQYHFIIISHGSMGSLDSAKGFSFWVFCVVAVMVNEVGII